jgi:hypothetical protein
MLSWILGGGTTLLLIIGAAFLLGGWPLLFNRNVLIALAAIGLVVFLGASWAKVRGDWVAEGRKLEAEERDAKDKLAKDQRREEISTWVVDLSQRDAALREKLRVTEQRLALQPEGVSHVSAVADSACSVPRGFLFDLAAAVPGAAGHSAVQPSGTSLDKPSGIPLSRVSGDIVYNYTQCSRLLARSLAEEERRYNACLDWDKKWGTRSGCRRYDEAAAGEVEAVGHP